MQNTSESLFIKCDCSGHMLEVERYDEGDLDVGFNISCWHYGHDGNIRRWKDRLRWCWRILITGNPWADSITLNDKRALEICKFIHSRANK